MKRIFLTGCCGQLGWELERTLSPLGLIFSFDYPEIDLKKIDRLRQLILEIKPHVIVNAAAYTAVDQAETEAAAAMVINADAPGELAEIAKKTGAVLIHYSTDYVFDGQNGSPYLETDDPNPLNVYGKSKLLGEQAVTQAGAVYLISSYQLGLQPQAGQLCNQGNPDGSSAVFPAHGYRSNWQSNLGAPFG